MPMPSECAGFANAAVITPSDTVNLTYPCDAIYVGGTGNITAVMKGSGDTCLFSTIPAGTTLKISATRVNSTATTATTLVAMWN